MTDFSIKSTAFKEGELIPPKFTCDGDDVNPFLEFRGVPEGTQSLALVVDDTDSTRGGVFDHWLIWNITPGTQYVSEDNIPSDAVQGANSWGKPSYGGPCPPLGGAEHRYRFIAYALDTMLELPAGSSRLELEYAMTGHILAEATLLGRYARTKEY